jgi:predicted component of type VI protein secretion system
VHPTSQPLKTPSHQPTTQPTIQQNQNQQQQSNNKPIDVNHPVVQELVKAKDPTQVITALTKLGIK